MAVPIRIRLFFEWGGGALWPGNDAARERFDVGPLDDRLGLPDALLARLRALSVHRDSALNWADPAAPGPWSASDHGEFCKQVAALRADIAAALGPGFDVVNDERDCPDAAPRHLPRTSPRIVPDG